MVPVLACLYIGTILLVTSVSGRNITDDVTIDIQHKVPILIYDDDALSELTFNYTVTSNVPITTSFHIDNTKKAEIISESTFVLNKSSDGEISIRLKGKLIGRTVLSIFVDLNTPRLYLPQNGTLYEKYELITAREARTIDTIFNVVVILLVVVANIGMGCKVDIKVVKATLRRPLAPGIGMFSQFIFMPAVSFLVVYLLDMEPAIALGYFALGCSPGGSASNIYTFLLGGDVSLSVTMTLISTFASLGLIPLWLFTVGQMVIYKGTTMKIPFENIFISLIGILIPVIIGLILQHKKPTWSEKMQKLVKPIVIIFLLFVFTVGVYANLYVFKLLDAIILLAGALIPYCGFILGFLVAFVTRQPKPFIIAIAIETGIQNTGLPIVLLKNSLSPPESDMSIVGPVAAAIFTPLPMVIAIGVLEIRKRWCKKKRTESDLNMMDEPATFTKIPNDNSPMHSPVNNGDVLGVETD